MIKKGYRFLSIILAAFLGMSLLPLTAATSIAAEKDQAITRNYGNKYQLEKVSNPSSGPRKADGINTNDETGYEANRLNSYAWAVASRGDYIYVGTNRTLFGSALNAVAAQIAEANPDTPMTKDRLNNIVALVSLGEVPVNLKEEDYIPQIIRFDVKKGTSKVIYQPSVKRGDDGVLYYTDKNGEIIPTANVSAETASFRSVVEYGGNLYFGSLGIHMLQLVRIDQDDSAHVVYQTIGMYSSLRAGCVYNDGANDLLCFGGQDTTYGKWRRDYGTATDRPLPIVVRYLNPSTAGSESEDWTGLIADYEDFGKYAKASVYISGGGTVWDLCSYNGKLYIILAYDGGWAMFRGEKGGAKPNAYGWTWTEVVGDNGKYPLAMDAEIGIRNAEFSREYGCSEYAGNLNGAGLLESTATPFVYKGKMYIGSFDNATTIQAQTVIKYLVKLQMMMNPDVKGNGPTLKQIYAPIYEVLKHPQRVWVMDENENIKAVEGANELLKDTTNDYVWRFIEYHGKLYTGTFDSSTAFNYLLGMDLWDYVKGLISSNSNIPENVRELFSGSIMKKTRELLQSVNTEEANAAGGAVSSFLKAADAACNVLEKFYQEELSVEEITSALKKLETTRKAITANLEKSINNEKFSALIGKVDTILGFFDVEGLAYWAAAKSLIRKEAKGFDLFVTGDGEKWEKILDDGAGDRYNYGGRTFTVCNDELYLGTANPYFGGQLWKIKDLTEKSGGEGESSDTPEPRSTVVSLQLKAGKTTAISTKDGKIASWVSTNKKVAVVKNGKVTTLKKGSATVTVKFKTGKTQIYKVKVTTSPKLSKKTIKIKLGKTAKVKIIEKAPGTKFGCKRTKNAKVISKRTTSTLKIKAMKKGTSTLKVKVNGIILKLKVIVK